jgi:hypothetical protein
LQDAESLCAKKSSHLFLQLKPVQGHPRWVSIEQRALASVFGQRTRTESLGHVGWCRSLDMLSQKKRYGTWMHPETKQLYQMDHFIVHRREDLKRVRDCGHTVPLLDSDHEAIKLMLRLCWSKCQRNRKMRGWKR